MENPWNEIGDRHWSTRPRDEAQKLHVADVSHADWSAVIEPGMFVPEIKPDTREYNSDFES